MTRRDAGLEAGVEHVAEVKPHPVAHTTLDSLVVGEPDLILRDRDAVDLAAEAIVGHEARGAPARAGIQQAILGLDVAEVVEQEVRLRRLEPVQFGEDPGVAGLLRAPQYGAVVVADPVVVVIQPVDVAEQPVDVVLPAGASASGRRGVVPVRSHGLLVIAAQDVGAGVARGHGACSFCVVSGKPGTARLTSLLVASRVIAVVAAAGGVPFAAAAHPGPGVEEEPLQRR